MAIIESKIENRTGPAEREPEIHVMPEKYLGAAVGAAIPPVRREVANPAAPVAASVRTASPGKGLIIAGVTIIAVVLIALTALFWPRKKAVSPAISPPVVVNRNANTPVIATTTPPVATSTPEAVVPIRNAEDSDADGLTDVEEREIYGTDPYKSDSDNDGYLDGSEVYYLYNPNGIAPVTLKDSGLARPFTNQVAGYSLLVPTPWTAGEKGTGNVFTSATGEFVELAVIDAPENQNLKDWYVQNNPGVLPGDVLVFVNRTGATGIKSPDGLGIYFKKGARVFALTYNLAGGRVVSYRRTFEMMGNSFRFESAEIIGGNASSTNFAASGTPTGSNSTTTPVVESDRAATGTVLENSLGVASSTSSTP